MLFRYLGQKLAVMKNACVSQHLDTEHGWELAKICVFQQEHPLQVLA